MTFRQSIFHVLIVASLVTACSKDNDPEPPPPLEPTRIDTLTKGWQKSFPNNLGLYGQYLRDVFFVDANIGYACATTVISKTTDGGLTWGAFTPPQAGGISDLFFIDANHGWTVDRELGNTMLRTTDGGNSWKLITIPQNAYPLSNVQFLNHRLGYMTSASQGLLQSTDSGNTWKPVVSNKTSLGTGLYFIDSLRGWITNGQDVRYTLDAGKTFQDQKVTTEANKSSCIQFTDAMHGWINSNKGLWKTSNGGSKWELVKEGNASTVDLHFFDQNKGYILRQNIIYKTMDGGASFTKAVDMAGLYYRIYKIHFTDEHHGWAIADGNVLLRFND